jgi:hypothetical protein
MQAISRRLSKADEHQKSGDKRREHRDTEHFESSVAFQGQPEMRLTC